MKLHYISKTSLLNNQYRNEIFVLITLVLTSFFLRFYDIGGLGFSNDEAIYVAQAASIANFEEFREHFSIFRAHPLLMQFFVSLSLSLLGISELSARLVPVLMGTGIVFLSYFIARIIYSKKIATISALIIAFLPYHIIISKQVLVDVSFSFFLTLTILLVVIYLKSNSNNLLLFLIGACSGFAFLSKEIGIIVLIASIISISLNKKNYSKYILLLSTFLIVTSPYWISFLFIDDARKSIVEYFNWQSSRPSNHDNTFYFEVLSKEAIGYPLSIMVLIFYFHFIVNRKVWNSLTILIPFIWIPILFIFYVIVPIKNFTFLYSIIPLFVIIGVSVLFSSPLNRFRFSNIVILILIPVILISNTFFFSNFVFSIPYYPTLGSESVDYMKDASLWIKENTPKNSTTLSLYTHMSNLIKFYSQRDSIALQSNNNPAYDKIDDADFLIVSKKINYLVYEKVQLDNANFLKNEAKKMNEYIKKHDAMPVYTSYTTNTDGIGNNFSNPAIIIYAIN